MSGTRRISRRFVITLIFLFIGVHVLVAKAPNEALPSQYAPIDDLVAAVEMFLEQIDKDLDDESEYGEDEENRVLLNANTLIVLGQTLGAHDAQHQLKATSGALVATATALTETAGEYDAAFKAMAAIKRAVEASADGSVDWEPVADLQSLMRQVPIVNNSLRRGVTGRRFDRMVDKNAGYASTLAAIAQASAFYTDYCADEEDEANWAAICVEMRDAAAQVNAAVRRKDQETATAGLARLVKTCDACHESFRD